MKFKENRPREGEHAPNGWY